MVDFTSCKYFSELKDKIALKLTWLALWRKRIIPLRVAKKGIHFLFQAEAERGYKTSIDIVLYYKYRAPNTTSFNVNTWWPKNLKMVTRCKILDNKGKWYLVQYYIYIYIWFKKLMTPLSSHYWKFCQPALERALPFLFVYKLNLCTSQPHFQGQKSDFSSFLVKEVKFRQIEISQKVNLLFPHRTKAVWKNVCSTVQRHNRNQLQQLCVKPLEFYYFKFFCWQRVCWKVTKLEHN